jgi:hypothetical protein
MLLVILQGYLQLAGHEPVIPILGHTFRNVIGEPVRSEVFGIRIDENPKVIETDVLYKG